MPVVRVGQTKGAPVETRESGDNLVKISDGGGPFQAYGPLPGEDPQPPAQTGGWLGDAGRDNFSPDIPGSWPGEKVRQKPRRQIIDDGGDS